MRPASRAGFAALVAACLSLPVVGAEPQAGQATEPSIVFTMPRDGEHAAGLESVTVKLEPPDVPFKSVRMYADGRLLCTVERRPIACEWDAGVRVTDHVLSAVATLADGRIIHQSIRTKGIPYYTDNVDVNVIHVTTLVRDGAGGFVRDLGRGDFRITDRGVRQAISFFPPPGNVPLEIIVAVDISGSMADAMPQVKSAVKKFVTALRPKDQQRLMAFNDNPITLAGPTATLEERLRKIDRLAPWGGTALFDLIVQAIDQMGSQNSRRVLVVFTDGEDLDSHINQGTAERRLEMSDVVLYAIGQGRAASVKELKGVLERLAQRSGGRAFFEEVDALDGVFASILEELAAQYLLGFAPTDDTPDGSWHPITVEVPGKNYQVRARQGYRAKLR
jgi:VWFA-related protein